MMYYELTIFTALLFIILLFVVLSLIFTIYIWIRVMDIVEFIKKYKLTSALLEDPEATSQKEDRLLEFKPLDAYSIKKFEDRKKNRERVARFREKKRELETAQAPEKE